jgi:acetyl-CoA carboxylase carboxyltransferase component
MRGHRDVGAAGVEGRRLDVTWEPEIEEIAARTRRAMQLGGPERVQDQHDRGKLTVRERIGALIDEGSFLERGVLAGSGEYDDDGRLTEFMPASFVMGVADIQGRPVVVGGGDYTARARPSSGREVSKSAVAERMALDLRLPMVRLLDGFGADIRAIESIGRTYIPANPQFEVVAALLGEVPVVSIALGAVGGGRRRRSRRATSR